MATGVNYWSSYEPSYKVSERVWWSEPESSSEEGGGGVTWETQAMEVKGQLISAPDPFTRPNKKHQERMAALQERRQSLQALLNTRLAELRRICLQEAELTGAVPTDFPLEDGEKPPCVRRRVGTSRHANRKYRGEEEDSQRVKMKKTLFSGALRKHSDSEQNTNTQTHTYHSKRTVHRGCHTDDTVRSESSSTSDSTGHDNDECVSQCRPPLVSAGSPVEVFYQNKIRRNSVHNRTDHPETLQTHRPLPLPPSHPPPMSLHPPPPPPRSQDSSSSSGPSDPGPVGEVRGSAARNSNSSDGLLDHINAPEEEGGLQHGGLRVNSQSGSRGTNTSGVYRSSEMVIDGRTKTSNGLPDWGGTGQGRGRGGGYSDILLDYVWGKQQQLQRQQSQTNNRQPIVSHHQPLYNAYTSQQHLGAPPTSCGHPGDQRRIKVTRTKSCGPFLSVQQSQADTHNPPVTAIQPDPHPHLLPPRKPQLPTNQDAQLEDTTRSIHKALALEGLRDWYLRNTLGSTHQNQPNGKVNTGVNAKVNGGAKCKTSGGGALQGRRRTHGVAHQLSFQTETSHNQAPPHRKQMLPHSATFHGHPLHGRSMDISLYHDSYLPQKPEAPLRDPTLDQPPPGTLV